MRIKQFIIPLLLTTLIACNSSSPANKLTKASVNKVSEVSQFDMSQLTYDSYVSFAKKFTKIAIGENIKANGEISVGVSIPDAYICLAIVGVISLDDARQDILNFLGLNSVEELRTSVKEILATLATLTYYNNKYYGGYNLNSIWLNPLKVQLKEKDPELYSDLENIFDATTYLEPLTSAKANDYLKENGLKDMPTPKIEFDDSDPSAVSAMSVYYCMDHFNDEVIDYYHQQYQSGKHKMDYEVDGQKQSVDYIGTEQRGKVYEGSNYHGATMSINHLSMSYFLPDEKDVLPSEILDDVLDNNYQLKEGVGLDFDNNEFKTNDFDVTFKSPYFSIDSKIEISTEILRQYLPVITSHGAAERLVEPLSPFDYLYLESVSQFNKMRFNYDGFYSCSVTIAQIEAKSAMEMEYPKYTLDLSHPYLFQTQKNIHINNNEWKKIPIVIGEIINPDYKE